MSDNYKILIIDDEEVVLDSCTEILRGSQYKLATASNGSLGLEMIEEFQPDLVFVDLKMPGMPGLEVLERVRAYDATIVTVVITGFATIGSAVDAMKRGAHDFLPKPFTPDEFRLIIRRALEKRKLILETLALRKEKEMLRANFAAIVSHELKSPLSAVQQNLFVLTSELSGQISSDQLVRLERMKFRIAELLELIRTWLRVISADIETIKENFEEIDIEPLIYTAIESVNSQATRKDIELHVHLDQPLSHVTGDSGTLTEVLVNILNNAVKYSYPGSEVRTEAFNQDGEVVISISDQGIGISDEDLPHIFSDFYSGKQGHQEEKGYGLGLALCSRIIEIHDGSITVESEPGKGSTFRVWLPTCPNESQANEPAIAGFSSSQLEGEL
ncbi:MAG TPA: hybrid sensor histidine kinase/response regulator [candidate division Zixibacteria bacterium]|nr:hybrid sensor histidine kinase/response regulator [candidate division Zixibacteria bacterium]